MTTAPTSDRAAVPFMSVDAFLAHWQGHRKLTRRLIEAFPEEQLYSFSIGGMRTFGALVLEMLAMTVPMVRGTVSNRWDDFSFDRKEMPKAQLLAQWDDNTVELATLWPQIPPSRFTETIKAFNMYEGVAHDLLLYIVDNEIHHRGQGYVYLRALGVEPPPFYER